MALISTMPRSGPILYCMKTRANRPEIVVRELERISGMDFERESMAASLTSYPFLFSSLNRLQKMIA